MVRLGINMAKLCNEREIMFLIWYLATDRYAKRRRLYYESLAPFMYAINELRDTVITTKIKKNGSREITAKDNI